MFSGLLVSLDDVQGLGTFIEVEIQDPDETKDLHRVVMRLLNRLGARAKDRVPWSYSDLQLMTEVGRRWRGRLAEATNPGTLFLIDGASSVGKTSLLRRLAEERTLDLAVVPRHTTRRPRDSRDREEAIFVTPKHFDVMAANGRFLEFRDFEFGMSYGLSWHRAVKPLLAGRAAVGLINLGNSPRVRELFPEAILLLIEAPEGELKRRLGARGVHNVSQMEERLVNAREVAEYRSAYDHVITNSEGKFEEALDDLVKIIRSRHPVWRTAR